MAQEDLEKYVEECRAKGIPDSEIRQELLKSGWAQADVDAVFGGGRELNSYYAGRWTSESGKSTKEHLAERGYEDAPTAKDYAIGAVIPVAILVIAFLIVKFLFLKEVAFSDALISKLGTVAEADKLTVVLYVNDMSTCKVALEQAGVEFTSETANSIVLTTSKRLVNSFKTYKCVDMVDVA